MKLLFVMLNGGYVRNYESVIGELASRGHTIQIAQEEYRDKLGEDSLLRRLTATWPTVTAAHAPAAAANRWTILAEAVRTLQDYIRYFEPWYAASTRLRMRAEHRVPESIRSVVRRCAGTGRLVRRSLGAILRWIEWTIPIEPGADHLLDASKADVLLVTPLVDFGSRQVDYIKAARARSIPSALCVASWDNLTNKGAIRYAPDRVFVWNAAQVAEATTMHGVPADRVVATGAQLFDEFFERRPSRSRASFCERVGLPDEAPFVVYLGSSPFVAPRESEFVAAWLAAIRSAGSSRVRRLGVLVRPHPANARHWEALRLGRDERTSLWPLPGAPLYDEDFKADYFDALFYCAAAIGINTSAFIEAAIIGRPLCTVRVPDFDHSQAGMLHFRHLVAPGQELLHTAGDLTTHIDQLEAILTDPDPAAGQSRAFVARFVRPHGMSQPVTPILADAIERIPHEIARRPGRVTAPTAVQACVGPLASAAAELWTSGDRPLWATVILRPLVAVGVLLADPCYRVVIAATRAWSYTGEAIWKGLRRVTRWVQSAVYEVRSDTVRVGRLAAKRFRKATKPMRRASARVADAIRRRIV